jgi:transcriptional regulator with XRE-family HTH domain
MPVKARRGTGMSRKIEEQTKFERFVRDFGVENLAQRLNVESSAVYHWLSAANKIRPDNADKIKRLAKRRGVDLSIDEIYAHFRMVSGNRYTTSSLKLQPARA